MPRALVLSFAVALVVFMLAPAVSAQDSTSTALAKQLTAALDSTKLDAIAARDPSAPDTFVAALYFAGSQLLVVSAKYTAPQLLDARLEKKEFRDVYIDLSSASIIETKVFVQDGGADGLKARREENQVFDSYEAAGKSIVFDGDNKRQKMSDQEYLKAFTDADARYSAMLRALLAQLKKTS